MNNKVIQKMLRQKINNDCIKIIIQNLEELKFINWHKNKFKIVMIELVEIFLFCKKLFYKSKHNYCYRYSFIKLLFSMLNNIKYYYLMYNIKTHFNKFKMCLVYIVDLQHYNKLLLDRNYIIRYNKKEINYIYLKKIINSRINF